MAALVWDDRRLTAIALISLVIRIKNGIRYVKNATAAFWKISFEDFSQCLSVRCKRIIIETLIPRR